LRRAAVGRSIMTAVQERGQRFGCSAIGKGGTVVIDFSHPNIAKPFHFGHLRSTNLGADLGRILEFLDFNVVRKNYLGDWGTQFGYVLYAWEKYGDEEQLS